MPRTPALLALLAAAALTACAPKPKTTEVASPAQAVAAQPARKIAPEELVGVDVLTSNHFVRSEKPGEIDVRLRLTAKGIKGAERPPINLSLVVDTSGSMEGAAIADARKASEALLDALSEGDRLSLVVFHSTTEILVPSTQLTKESIAEIRAKIGSMKASGTTDLAGGLSTGLSQVSSHFQPNGINRVVLLGDGVPNDPSSLPSFAQSAAQQHISITALGLGLDYDETVMSKLALTSGGKYHFIRDSSEVAKVFSDEVLRLKAVSGRQTIVTLAPGPGVAIKEVLGLPLQQTGPQSYITLGDLSEGEERDLIVRLTVPGRHAGSVVELLDAQVSFDHPFAPGQRLTAKAFVSVKATSDSAEIDKGRERDVEHSAARLGVAGAIVRAVAAARAGDLPSGRAILDAAEKEAKLAAKEFNDTELAEKVKTIGPLRKSLASLVPPPPPPPGSGYPGGGYPAGGPRPLPPAAKPAAAPGDEPMPAAVVLKSQAEAMRTLQGD